MATIEVSIAFESGARLGPVQGRLLESIQETGSISAAARRIGVPYKRAWIILDAINRALTEPVVEAATGGKGGGGAVLTAFGADVLKQYRRIAAAAERAVADDVATLARAALDFRVPDPGEQAPKPLSGGRRRAHRKRGK